jgi:hypothetical protein
VQAHRAGNRAPCRYDVKTVEKITHRVRYASLMCHNGYVNNCIYPLLFKDPSFSGGRIYTYLHINGPTISGNGSYPMACFRRRITGWGGGDHADSPHDRAQPPRSTSERLPYLRNCLSELAAGGGAIRRPESVHRPPEWWLSPSLNRVRLATNAVLTCLCRSIRGAAPTLLLSPGLSDGELLSAPEPPERSFTSDARAAKESSRALADGYGRCLAYLLLALR